MRFRVGPPLNSLSDSELRTGKWTQLRVLPAWSLQLLSPLAGCLVTFFVLILWAMLRTNLSIDANATWQVPAIVVAVIGTGLLLQLASYPDRGLTKDSVLGIWLQRLTPYTYFSGHVSKKCHLASLLVPVTALVAFPFVVALLTRHASGWLAFSSCVGAFAYGINLFRAASFALRVPAGALIDGRGLDIYWRPRD